MVDLVKRVEVTNDLLLSRSGWTFLDGQVIHGWPVAAFLRGQMVAHCEAGAAQPDYVGTAGGRFLRRVPEHNDKQRK